ncbi:MAG: cytochrome c family protein [Rhizomicrobium sp.]|jgi:cytochrome c
MIVRKLVLGATMLAFLSSAALAAADAKKGQEDFARCAICHTVAKGGGNGLGPDLFGVVGRKAASLPNFYYSQALKSSGITWTPDKLDAWIKSPATLVPGNRMAFAGIAQAGERADIVAYLASLK